MAIISNAEQVCYLFIMLVCLSIPPYIPNSLFVVPTTGIFQAFYVTGQHKAVDNCEVRKSMHNSELFL